LLADAKGDLFGTTPYGGPNGNGTVFELVKTCAGYTEKILHSFNATPTDGVFPLGSLLADAKGDLFGTTSLGGAYNFGTAFELVKTSSGYTEKVLHSFLGFGGSPTDGAYPGAGLIADVKGDLFGTTSEDGPNGVGTAFELVKTGSGYIEKTLHSFRGSPTDGAYPGAGFLADAKGDLFSTTGYGGANNDGAVFELVKTGSGYTEKVLHSFRGDTTDFPSAGLIADAKGDLFGTTEFGGAHDDGMVFELVKTCSGYAEKVLHSFSGSPTDGFIPGAGLLADAKGDLFGTTAEGGAYGERHGGFGTAFELVKTGSGYAEKLLYSFSGTSGNTATSIVGVLNGLHFG
jgi:uncharacterized repeat protein (TIGR03803 family)